MRGAVWAVLLLLLPVTSGLTLTPPTEHHVPRNGEHLLVLEEGVWTSAKWKVLEDVGIQPLRSIRADALLVWAENDRDSWPFHTLQNRLCWWISKHLLRQPGWLLLDSSYQMCQD